MVLENISTTQQGLPALSSGEAEIRASSRGASEGLLTQNILRGLGLDLPLRLWTDSSAARQAARKLGVGRMRHLNVHDLFVQTLIEQKGATIHKIAGVENRADRLTKYPAKDMFEKMSVRIGI